MRYFFKALDEAIIKSSCAQPTLGTSQLWVLWVPAYFGYKLTMTDGIRASYPSTQCKPVTLMSAALCGKRCRRSYEQKI
jgi:hypothetical protein